jgi:hypothetical protein
VALAVPPTHEDHERDVVVPPRPAGLRRRLIWPMLEPIIRSLSRETGRCFARAIKLRALIFEDHGYPCGERSVQRAIARETRKGTIRHRWIRPNRIYARGRKPTGAGTQWNWFPSEAELRAKRFDDKMRKRKNRAERRAAARAAEDLVRVAAPEPTPAPAIVERTTRRHVASIALVGELVAPPKLAELLARPPAPAPEPVTVADLEERRRAEVARQLAELRALGLLGDDKPPDE